MEPLDALIAEIRADTRATARRTGRDHLSPRVLDAMRAVRREAFVPMASRSQAQCNAPLPIGHGQTISQPFIVALMTDLLDLEPGDTVLEIGTGSGYQTAVLAELDARVCSIEIIPALAERAAQVLAQEGYDHVELRVGNGADGWPGRAPFDAIIVTAAGRAIPPTLIDQLALGGHMVIPIGEAHGDQELRLLTRRPDGSVDDRRILPVAFVPLTGGPGI